VTHGKANNLGITWSASGYKMHIKFVVLASEAVDLTGYVRSQKIEHNQNQPDSNQQNQTTLNIAQV